MTEKVKLTQEQADGIEHLKKKTFSDESIIAAHVRNPDGWLLDENVALNRIPLLKLVDALRIGYEVEPQFKVGDWVAHINGSTFMGRGNVKVVEILWFDDNGDATYGDGNYSISTSYIRHAAIEEIKAEKERQLWKSIDREVGEFKKGDIRILDDGNSVHITDVDYARAKYIQGTLKGFYPVESFISFESEETK